TVSGCEIIETGSVILPTKSVKSILTESPDKTLEISSDEVNTIIQGARSRFKLLTQPVSDFPEVEQFKEKSYTAVSAKIFKELIKRTMFATDEESTRYSLAGVHFDFGEENQLGTVATDGRRLAHQVGSAESVKEHSPEGSSIFPTKALTLIERAAGEDESIHIAVSANRAIFKTENAVVFTRLIEGKFPSWRKIIPQIEGKSTVEVVAGALLSSVRQAAIVTSDKQPGVIFTFDTDKLELRATGAETGESAIELPISLSGTKTELKLDPKFIIDFLRVLDSEKNITIYLSDSDPVLFRTDDNYEYVVMPISA
ncbi:MAG: DNA polymerase III subunit beta, partial [Thermoguttaceae bacterium]